MFIDEAEVFISAGHGGAGKASFFPGYKSGPDGGNGGNGGNVYLSVTSDLSALNSFQFKKSFTAGGGKPGGKFRKCGKNGQDIIVTIPVGSMLIDQDTKAVKEFNEIIEKQLFLKGGKGGRGTYYLASPNNTTPLAAEPGYFGEKKHYKIILKLIADFGLIGLPNAGKSSLLNALTAADVKVASYPFTTLEPNLGVMDGRIIADIPGLIEGASTGKGLGIKFLKHIEKVNLLIHCISSESDDPESDYLTIRKELENYNPMLIRKHELILLTKTDLTDKEKTLKISKNLSKFGNVLTSTIHDKTTVRKLVQYLSQI